MASAPWRAAKWLPMGQPSGAVKSGTLIAGTPAMLWMGVYPARVSVRRISVSRSSPGESVPRRNGAEGTVGQSVAS